MNKNLDIKTFNEAPNFSVVVPNLCYCKCAFCFDNQKTLLDFDIWYNQLEQIIDKLPEKFTQCSVSGGEPTRLSVPHLLKLMKLLYANFDRVVVTTNGFAIDKHIASLSLATFINISYHGTTKKESDAVFQSDNSPTLAGLKNVIKQLKALETSVRIQKVCTTPPTLNEVFEYVSFCKSMDANDIAIRMDIAHKDGLSGDWLPIPEEKAVSKGSCPVCADWTFNIENIPVHFKAGLIETDTTGVPYELIFRKDGRLSTTWGETVVVPKFIKKRVHKAEASRILKDVIERYADDDNKKWIDSCYGKILNPDYKEPLAILEKTYGKNKKGVKVQYPADVKILTDEEIQAEILTRMMNSLGYRSCRSGQNTPESIIKDFIAMINQTPAHPSVVELEKHLKTARSCYRSAEPVTPTEPRVSTSCGSGGCGGGSGACGRSKATSCGSGGSC